MSSVTRSYSRKHHYHDLRQNTDQTIKLNSYLDLSRCAVLAFIDRAPRQSWITFAHVQFLIARSGVRGLNTTTIVRKWRRFPKQSCSLLMIIVKGIVKLKIVDDKFKPTPWTISDRISFCTLEFYLYKSLKERVNTIVFTIIENFIARYGVLI